jgi:hypothetical protein
VLAGRGFSDLLAELGITLAKPTGRDPIRNPDTPGQEPADADSRLQAFYVEATSEQIEGLLAAMHSRPEDYLTVSVDAAPGSELQRGWQAKYSRSGSPQAQANSQQAAPARSKPRKGPAPDESADDFEVLPRPKARAWVIPVPGDRPGAAPDEASRADEPALMRALFLLQADQPAKRPRPVKGERAN